MTLKARRVAANMRQEEVAARLEVDQTAISKWETGKNKPSRKYQTKLAALYGCKVEELFDESEEI